MNSKEILDVGDVIFLEGNYGFLRKMQVEKVTPTMAFVDNGNIKLKRKLRPSTWDPSRLVIDKVARRYWDNGSYQLSTPELEAKFRAREIIGQLEEQRWKEYSNEDLEAIWKVVSGKLAGDIIAASYKK